MSATLPDPSASGDTGGRNGTIDAMTSSLQLAPHPEGGWFRRTWTSSHGAPGASVARPTDDGHRSLSTDGDRAAASSILYLLAGDDRSSWHRLTDAEEVWIHQAGDPVLLHISPDGVAEQAVVLGPPEVADAVPVATVGIGHWQSAERLDPAADRPPAGGTPSDGTAAASTAGTGWSLVSCVVSPEFRFEHFELAPPCWSPGGDQV